MCVGEYFINETKRIRGTDERLEIGVTEKRLNVVVTRYSDNIISDTWFRASSDLRARERKSTVFFYYFLTFCKHVVQRMCVFSPGRSHLRGQFTVLYFVYNVLII